MSKKIAYYITHHFLENKHKQHFLHAKKKYVLNLEKNCGRLSIMLSKTYLLISL